MRLQIINSVKVITALWTCLILAACSSASVPSMMNTNSLGASGKTAVQNATIRNGKNVDLAPQGKYTKAPQGGITGKDYTHARLNKQQALAMINKYRASKGLSPLSLDETLSNVALRHSKDLAKHDRISHYGSDGSNPWDRVSRSGYKPQLAAENVGTGQANLAEVFKGWQDSPGHDKNMLLPDAKNLGIALVYDPKTEYKTFWTMILGTKL